MLRYFFLIGDRMNTLKRWMNAVSEAAQHNARTTRPPSLLMSSRTSHNCFSCAKDTCERLIGLVRKITDIVLHDKVMDIAGDKLAADRA